MSEEVLSDRIDLWVAEGDLAVLTDDPEARALSGTVRLARSALLTPKPPARAEAESRARVLAHLRDDALSPRLLRPAERPPTLLARLRDAFRHFRGG